MYLTDLRAGRAPRYDLVRYALYIAFFPQVLAGPLVRWSEIMHQLDERPYERPDAAERFARGLMLLVCRPRQEGVPRRPARRIRQPGFRRPPRQGKAITFVEAWQATLGFTFQIYFDFSGYTDMALGLALLFGIVLPQNFDVPYRSVSLQDFWRRWHMTLSRFLRDYLYIPLGGNRNGLAVQVARPVRDDDARRPLARRRPDLRRLGRRPRARPRRRRALAPRPDCRCRAVARLGADLRVRGPRPGCCSGRPASMRRCAIYEGLFGLDDARDAASSGARSRSRRRSR